MMDYRTYTDFDDHEQVVVRHDLRSGLRAIIAVHNTSRGPALGGCRMWPYASEAEALTDALATYDGTLLFVSHNRAFIRRLATKLWVVHDGGVESYAGTLDDYLWSCQDRDVAPATETAIKPAAQKKSRHARKEERRKEAELRARRNRTVKPLQKRVGELEGVIATLESTIAKHNEELSRPDVYDDADRRDALLREVAEAQVKLDLALEEWTEAQQKLEELAED